MTSDEGEPNQCIPAVIVGVDGSAGSLRAVRWAATEATVRRVPLRLVHAVDPSSDAATSRGGVARSHSTAQRIVDAARTTARRVAAEVTVVTDVVDGPPTQALVREDAPAVMICVGSSGVAPPHPGHRACTATEVLLAAACAVTVVRAESASQGWVVAEISGEPAAADLLHAAVEEAVLRRAPLRILTRAVATSPVTADDLRARLMRDVNRYRAEYPNLDMIVPSAAWGLGDFLRRYTDQIALFVAAPRQLHDIGTVLHPSASMALTLLHCPVMICGSGVPASSVSVRDYE